MQFTNLLRNKERNANINFLIPSKKHITHSPASKIATNWKCETGPLLDGNKLQASASHAQLIAA
ncbi:hypothetical protein K3495_g6295 [Podosphaera aphanis]|nr:hypothetical protein K3495_g6295 [Podosphaera aphanis]